MAVAQDDIGRTAAKPAEYAQGGLRWHGVAVDQDRRAAAGARFLHQAGQCRVKRVVYRLDPLPGLGKGQLAGIDVEALSDDTRQGAEPGRNAFALFPDECGQRIHEHGGVELVRLAVQIKIGPRIDRTQQRDSERRRKIEQFMNKSIFGAPQRMPVESGRGEERRGIKIPAVRR